MTTAASGVFGRVFHGASGGQLRSIRRGGRSARGAESRRRKEGKHLMPAERRQAHEREQRRGAGEIRRVLPGTFRPDPPGTTRQQSGRNAPNRPALVMVLAPLLGLLAWGAILYLILA